MQATGKLSFFGPGACRVSRDFYRWTLEQMTVCNPFCKSLPGRVNVQNILQVFPIRPVGQH